MAFESVVEDLVPLLVSLLLGTIVGWERESGGKSAGLRTHTLVCLGSTLFTILTPHTARVFSGGDYDPTRVVFGIVTGVGFLGAGTIIRQDGAVHGLTTAANIWMVAAIGVAVGVRAYATAGFATLLALLVLRGYRIFDRFLEPERRQRSTPREPASPVGGRSD
ncbi:MAG TPA: MgtC/SapB family protein [Gemmatimonadales bacterium]|nr:MgtC/SapB family protein [Gemmatimonadales bacterium]